MKVEAELVCVCGFRVLLDHEPVRGEAHACEGCGAQLNAVPVPVPRDAIQWAGSSEIEAGAAKVRELVDEIKRR